MKKCIPMLILAGTLLSTAGQSYADDFKRFFAGGSTSRGEGTIEDTPVGDIKSTMLGYSVTAGYNFSPKWRIDTTYTDIQDLDLFISFSDDDFDMESYRVTINYTQSLVSVFFARARLGYEFWNADGHTSFDYDEADIPENGPWTISERNRRLKFTMNGNDITYGLSLGIGLRVIEIAFDYDAIGGNEVSTDLYSIAVRAKLL